MSKEDGFPGSGLKNRALVHQHTVTVVVMVHKKGFGTEKEDIYL